MASSGCFLSLECCLYPRIHFFLSRGLYSGPNCGYEELASRTVNSHAVHAGGAGGVSVVGCERDDPLGRVFFAVHPKTRKNDVTCPRVDALRQMMVKVTGTVNIPNRAIIARFSTAVTEPRPTYPMRE
ncbi:hypothetical protein B0H10DRAFT_1942695 [Mycena sp. CBHHK59/15]|nr:hypothetical protein B0H10DRAFT_1942695 [Mycena sp. CBHHK59/15]